MFSESIRDRFVVLWGKGLQNAGRQLMSAQIRNQEEAIDLAAAVVRAVLGGIVNEATLAEAQFYAKPQPPKPKAA